MSEDKWEPTRNTVNYTIKNIFSILGMIFAFVCPPVGLILSIIGFRKAKAENGDTKFAKLGIIISGIMIAIIVIVAIIFGVTACQTQQKVNDVADTIITIQKDLLN